MSLEHKGFVGLFAEPLKRSCIEELVSLWLKRYGKLEQTVGNGSQVLTQMIYSLADLSWNENLQFRVLCGEQFAWIYLTQDRYVIETSGLIFEGSASLCRDVLVDLPGCNEIIDEHNDHRLDELETQGLM